MCFPFLPKKRRNQENGHRIPIFEIGPLLSSQKGSIRPPKEGPQGNLGVGRGRRTIPRRRTEQIQTAQRRTERSLPSIHARIHHRQQAFRRARYRPPRAAPRSATKTRRPPACGLSTACNWKIERSTSTLPSAPGQQESFAGLVVCSHVPELVAKQRHVTCNHQRCRNVNVQWGIGSTCTRLPHLNVSCRRNPVQHP